MDPRRRKAVVLATLPATTAGVYLPLTAHFHGSRFLPFIAVGGPMLMLIPLVFSFRFIRQLKRDGNPY